MMEVAAKEIEFERYSKYKDSGIEWLGKVPSHWKIKRLKYSVNIVKRIVGNEGADVLSITQNGIIVKDILSGEGQLASDYSNYQIVEKGDFAMNHMDLLTGYVDMSKYCGVTSPDYRVFKLTDDSIAKQYFLKLLQLCYDNKIFYGYGRGVSQFGRWRLPASSFNNFLIPIPPKEEQTAIANFLDEKTAKIDEAISIKQRQIELLKERRQILIHKAVTRGLNPDVPLKPSGVDWIGDIPELWEVKRFKYVTDLISIKTTGAESDLKYIGMENVESWTGNYIDSEGDAEGAANTFQKGDILFGKLRPYLAKVFLAEDKGICSTELLVYRSNSNVFNYYMKQFMISYGFISLINSSTYGAKMPRANSDFIGNQLMIIPPIEEQREICAFINSINEKIERITEAKKVEIIKLKEYKTTLINSTVTGKIKVS